MVQAAVASRDRQDHPFALGAHETRGGQTEAASGHVESRQGDRPFGFRVQALGEYLICQPEGDLDTVTASRLRASFAELTGPATVVVDLASVPFIDAAGLGALVGGIRRIRDAGGAVVVSTGGRDTARTLLSAGFDRWVTVVDSLAKALAAEPWSLDASLLDGAA